MDLSQRSIAQVNKMRNFRWILALTALALAACGGDVSPTGAFTDTGGTGGGTGGGTDHGTR